MKYKTLIGMCILLCIGLVIATECQDETDVSDIPCTMITPILIDCVNYTYNVTEVATGLLKQNGSLVDIGDGTYKFEFTPSRGIYNVFVCENNTYSGSITVGDYATEVNVEDWGILFILILTWVVLFVGLIFNEDFFTLISSLLLIIIGIYILNNGFFEMEGFIVQWFPVIQTLIGLFILIVWTHRRYQDY